MTRNWRNLVDTSEFPILTRGGPSSSHVLNKINERIQQDIVQLNSEIQQLDRTQRLVSIYLQQQAVGIQAIVNSLQTLIPAAPSNRGVADFFSTDFIHVDNTANVDQDYGQVTLPILSIQEKLHSVDSQGNVWVPDDSRITFLPQTGYTAGNVPDDSLFFSSVEDHYGIGNQPDTFFLGGYLNTESYLYVKATLPQTLNTHRLSNRLTFHPVPAFSHSLVGAYYRKTDGSWNQMEFDYLPGYTNVTVPPQASFLGPTKLHFQPAEITQVCIVMKASGWWGIQQFGVQLVEYGSSANLVVDMSSYNPTAITSVLLSGRYSSILNRYISTITGSKVSTALSQTEAYSSPVITAVDVRF